jgi:hypothetical protein
MKRIRFILFVIILVLSVPVQAQLTPKVLKSDYIPEEIDLVHKVDSITSEVRNNNLYEKRAIRSSQIKFIYESVFYNQSIKQSGQIIYNKELDKTIAKLVNHIISNNTNLISHKVSTSILRSSVINAFASDEGNLFLTMGLLARIENEAQLAYVLCHELSHWIRKHGLEKVSEEVRIKTEDNSKTFFSNESKVLALHSFSKEIELDADDLGFDLFVNAGYDVKEIGGVFDILALSSLPMDTSSLTYTYPFVDIAIDNKYLADDGDKFDQDFIENEENDFSTHPMIASRRENIVAKSIITKKTGGKKYITSDAIEFQEIKQTAEYNIGEYYLYDLQFYSAFCHNQYLSNKYKDKRSKINLMRSWLGMTLIQTERLKDKYTKYYTTYNDGYIIKEYFKNTPKDVFKLSALVSAFNLLSTDVSDQEYQDLLFLTIDIVRKNPTKSQASNRYSFSSKRKPLFEVEFIEELFEFNVDQSEEIEKFKIIWDSLDSNFIASAIDEYIKSRTTYVKDDIKEQGILFINPAAYYTDENTITKIDLEASLQQNKALYKNLNAVLSKYDVNYKILSFEDSTKSNRDLVDQIFKSRLLIKQHALMGKNSRKTPYNLLISNKEIDELAQKFQCRYVSYTGLLMTKSSFGERKLESAIKLYFSAFTILGAPQVLSGTFYDDHIMTFYTMIYDTKTKQFIYSDMSKFWHTPNNELMPKYFTQYMIYDLLFSNDLSNEEDNN